MTHLKHPAALLVLALALAACGVRGALVPPHEIPQDETGERDETRFPAPVPVE